MAESASRGQPPPVPLTDAVALSLLGLLAGILGLLFKGISIDDAYITYRYAYNLLNGAGFVYNPGEAVLSTTAVLYALLLALLGLFRGDIPLLSSLVSLASLWGAAAFLYLYCAQFGQRWVGFMAALLLSLSPSLLATLGMETWFQMMAILAGFYLYSRGRLNLATLAMAIAFMTRGDALLAALILLGHYLWLNRRLPRVQLLLFLLLTLPLLLYLTLSFGSPLPATVSAKVAQMQVGWVGYLEGLLPWVERYWGWNPLLLLALLFMLLGLREVILRGGWAIPLLLWPLLHLTLYQILSVASYDWYYAPLMLGVSLLVALGIREASYWLALLLLGERGWLSVALACLLLSPILFIQLGGDLRLLSTLPDAKAETYQQVGLWIRANTPNDATVAVMEVGIIGYYAERRMVDFLGLLRPEVARALGRRDIFWSISHYRPDYLVLTAVNPLLGYWIQGDDWFRETYQPLQQFGRPRYWGSPVTLYARRGPAERPSAPAKKVDLDFGGILRLKSYSLDRSEASPGDYLGLRLDWGALARLNQDYSLFAHLVDMRYQLVSQHDIAAATTTWRSGETLPYYFHLKVPQGLPPGLYRILVGAYRTSTGERLPPVQGSVGGAALLAEVPVRSQEAPSIQHPQESPFADGITFLGYALESPTASRGGKITLKLFWRAEKWLDLDYTVFTHLIDYDGRILAQHDGEPSGGAYPTHIWSEGEIVPDVHDLMLTSEIAPGRYLLEVGLYLPHTGERLRLREAPDEDRLLLGEILVR